MKTKQVIVVIEEYAKKWRGKMMAQVAHASLGSLMRMMSKEECTYLPGGMYEEGQKHYKYTLEFQEGTLLDQWLNGSFTKVVVYVKTEKELLDLIEKLEDEKISPIPVPYALIKDSGLTVFHGQPTITCLGIGPWDSDVIDKVTGHLPLLK